MRNEQPDTPKAQGSTLEELKRVRRASLERVRQASVEHERKASSELNRVMKETRFEKKAMTALPKRGEKKKDRVRRFSRFTTDDGSEYFVPEGGGASVWTLPVDAKVVHF